MIQGKAKLEFGNGDIWVLPMFKKDGTGKLLLCSTHPGKVGQAVEIPENFDPNVAEVVMTFTNSGSVMVVIRQLLDIYDWLLQHEIEKEK